MRKVQFITSTAHAVAIVALASTLAAAACGERPGVARSADAASAEAALPNSEGETELAPPAVDPCKLFSQDELSDQLWLTVPPSQREHWTAKGFDVQATETPWGISRRCEFAYRSRDTASGRPTQIGTFSVMVFHATRGNMGIPERGRKPIPGVGDEAFQHQHVYYVRSGDLGLSLTDFHGTSDPGLDPDTPKLALLRLAADRLRESSR